MVRRAGAVLPVELDPLDRLILTVLDRDPTISYAGLSNELNVSPRTVADRLLRLRSHDIVRVVGRTLPDFDGRSAWLARAHVAPSAIGELAAELARNDRSRWVRIARDRTEMIAGFVTHSADDSILTQLESDRRVRSAHTYELLKVWSGQEGTVTHPSRQLDAIDRHVMRLLAEDGRMPNRELATRLALDPSTTSRRRRRLVEEGILFFEADIHPAALDASGDAMLWIRVSPGGIRDLGQWLRQQPECRFAAASSGAVSVIAHVMLPDAASLVDFVDEGLAGRNIVSVDIVRMGEVLKRNAGAVQRTPVSHFRDAVGDRHSFR
ncbi:winged helix-turn-helix transcriptional regulator [Streptomyces sp. NPDC102360]|uniref:winged helix-turn-helix transcriptional regulator n=1 Tax=Streptomyces sp. NPDC102360 TaxID=3366160 RepID=UPI003815299F